MERSVKKADVCDIPRKCRPLDSLSVSVRKSTTSSARLRAKDGALTAAPKSNVLKRKRSSPSENGASSSDFRKRRGKEVSLNSFVKGSGKGKLTVAVAGLKSNGLVSGVGKGEKISSSSVAGGNLKNVSGTSHHGGNDFTLPLGKDEIQLSSAVDLHRSNCLEGGIIITKRPRGALRRRKPMQSVNSDRQIAGASSSNRITTDQRSNNLSISQFQIHKTMRKLIEFKEDGSTDNGSRSYAGNGGNLDLVKGAKRRFLCRKGQDSDLLHNKDDLLSSFRNFPDDDEDNLEQNAARMLSSRFDPSYAGYSHSRVAPPKPAKESSLVLSQRNSNGSVAEMNGTNRVLRPRKHGGRGFVRKRRHFYEVCSNNMDPYWVVKQRIRVFWPLDKSWYFGLVKDYDPVTKMHHVKYDDRDEEWINLQNERFKLLLFPSEVTNKFNHERSIKEGKNRDNQGNKRSMNDLSPGGLVETEPIISWLTRSTRRERPSALGVIKMQRRILLASKGFKSVGIPNAVSNLSSSLLDRSAEDDSTQNINCSENRKFPLVYFRRRIRNDSCYSGNTMERSSGNVGSAGPISLLSSVTDTESALKELYIAVIPQVLTKVTVRLSLSNSDRCTSMLGSDNFLMCRRFFHHNYKLVQLLPLVHMEVGFVDHLSLKLFLFEGCLSWAVTLLCQTLGENYCYNDSRVPSADNMPLKKIKINMLNLHNKGQKLHFIVDGFVESNSRWRYLEKKLIKHCIRFMELSPGDCAYARVKSLSVRCGGTLVQRSKETVLVEDGQASKDKSNYISIEESDQVSDITLENFGSFSTAAIDSKLSSFARLRVDTDVLSLSNDGDYLKSSHDCLSIEVNGVACSVGYSDVGKNSSDEMFFQYHKLPKQTISYKGSKNLCSSFPDDPSSPDKSEGGCISSTKTTGIQNLRGFSAEERNFYRRTQDTRSASNLLWEINENAIHTPNATAPRSVWHHNRHILVSPILGPRSTLWSEDFIQSGFLSTTKKPRTQVSYPTISRGHDVRSKNRIYHRKGSLYKKFKADLPKKLNVGLESHRSFQESLTCHANVLITTEDRGWREFGAEVLLDSDDQKDWKIVVKLAGITKFSHKAHQVLQPGVPNRYTHAMMWKGGKDWSLEFTDRNQWLLFKMMHGQCFNQNIRAASVKNIPIPGVQLIDDGDESFMEVPFVRNSSKYYQLVGTEVETALDPSHVLYDMDSDDEKWISKFRDSLDNNDSMKFEVTDDMFERVMDMFEKVAYVKQCDCLNDDEIAEYMSDFGSLDITKAIYELWHEKRRKKGIPLIRQYQPPLWEFYQQKLKEWELAMINFHHPENEFQEKTTAPENPPEKPPMFAFCLKPRGLEANKGSKQRSHKKLMYGGHHSSFSREQDGLHFSGRRLNISSVGDEKAFVAIPSYEGPHSTQWLQSPLSFSPRDARAVLMASDGVDRNHHSKLFRNFSKKDGMHNTPWDSPVIPLACGEKSKRNGVYRWHSDTLEWPSLKHLQSDGAKRQQPDINEFRLRDASGAAQHASNMAKLKREKAQWLMHKADLALHKAVVAIMTADAIKTSQKDLIGDE